MKKFLTVLFFAVCLWLMLNVADKNAIITDDSEYKGNPQAILDVKSDNKGILIPRVALVASDNPVAGVKPDGLMIYNTSTSGKYSSPGYYIWDGNDWAQMAVVGKNTMKWDMVTDSAFQALPNHGYIINNPETVKVTLPDSPKIGDIVRIISVNKGGWELEQNPGQYILLDNLKQPVFEIKSLPFSRDEDSCFVLSYDASVIAVVGEEGVWSSNDLGYSWTGRAILEDKNMKIDEDSFQMSSDGKVMAVTGYRKITNQNGNYHYKYIIFTSTDTGVTWTEHTISDDENVGVRGLQMSSDGNVMAVLGDRKITKPDGSTYDSDIIVVSTDTGVTWTEYTISDDENVGIDEEYFHISSGGKVIVLTRDRKITKPDGSYYYRDIIFISTDTGVTWTEHTISDDENVDIDEEYFRMSSDGKVMAVVEDGYHANKIFVSIDYGTTWTEHITDFDFDYNNYFQISSDGSRMAVMAGYDIWMSTDFGVTWNLLDEGIMELQYPEYLKFDNTLTKGVFKTEGRKYYYFEDCGRTYVGIPYAEAYTFSGDGSTVAGFTYYGSYLYIYTNNTAPKGGRLRYLTGSNNASVELQYIGDGKFIPISSAGNINVQTK